MSALRGRMNESTGKLALASALLALLLLDAVMSQDPTETSPSLSTASHISITVPTTADLTSKPAGTTAIPDTTSQSLEKTTVAETLTTEAVTTKAQTADTTTTESNHTTDGSKASTMPPSTTIATTLLSSTVIHSMTEIDALGSTSANVPDSVPYMSGFQCVSKEDIKDKDAVNLVISRPSNCADTLEVLKHYQGQLCENDCQVQVFQKENTNKILITSNKIEANAQEMADTLKEGDISAKLGIQEATPRWGKRSPTVLVSLLLAGLLLAALLIGVYCFKTRQNHTSKGMRLAEEPYQTDEENQGNTLVSVAPLNPPEPQEKPSINGESAETVKNHPPPHSTATTTTNGHSASKQAPVADTEL
ncbi:serine-rich adhesin for platelets [Amia ocellicauda]|uniref:serine-rich adhesin for platelets n=1 Tax=Amia ocellicauda TaxID=2972642 RepID=UPI003464E36A